MNKPGKQGITHVIDATGYSWAGLQAAFKNEAAFRQELALFIILTPLALWLGDSGVERALLIGSLFLVVTVNVFVVWLLVIAG